MFRCINEKEVQLLAIPLNFCLLTGAENGTGGRTEKGQPPAADGARKVAIGIAVRPACRLETQVALRERGRADVAAIRSKALAFTR